MSRKSGLADSPFFTKPLEEETVIMSSLDQAAKKESEESTKSKHVYKHTSKQENKIVSKQTYFDSFLTGNPLITGSFRMPSELIAKFDEVFYLAKSKHKAKVKRYEVVVAALAFFFWDFENNGENSDFFKYLIKDKK